MVCLRNLGRLILHSWKLNNFGPADFIEQLDGDVFKIIIVGQGYFGLFVR